MSGFLTVAQLAEDSGFSPATVLRWIKRGDLVAVRFPGGQLRVRQADYAAMQQAGQTGKLVATAASGPAQCDLPGPGKEVQLHA